MCIMAINTPAGAACKEFQNSRYQWCVVEIIVLLVSLIFTFPPVLIRMQNKEKVHYDLFKPEEEEAESGDEDEDEDGK